MTTPTTTAPTVDISIDLPDDLVARLDALAKRERRTVPDQIVVLLEKIAEAPHLLTKGEEEITIQELIPLMPPRLRSRSSIMRLLKTRAIGGRKVSGAWTFKRSEVMADLDSFKRASSVAAALNPRPTKPAKRVRRLQ